MPKKWITLPVGEFMPDMPDFDNPGSPYMQNCLPRTQASYGPASDLAPFWDALTARCQGAISVIDSEGTSTTFAGDVNDLYNFTAASLTPAAVSKGVHPYTCPGDGQWNFDLMGERVVATDYNDPIQSFVLESSTDFADLANGGVLTLDIVAAGTTYTNGVNYPLVVTGGGGTGFTGLVDVVAGKFTNARITAAGKGFTSIPAVTLPAGAGAGDGTASITVTEIASIAPQGKYVAVVKNFLMLGFTNDAVSGPQSQRVWWSALNDPTNWPMPGTAAAAEFQSSFDDLFGNFGRITGIVGALGTADCAIFFERAIWRGVYAGPPVVFDFAPCETVRGTSAPNSIIKRGLLVDYLGEDGFYTFDGTSSVPIGVNKVDKTFYADLDENFLDRVYGACDPINRMSFWAYPGTGSVNGNPNRILVYNWVLERWAFIEMPKSLEMIFRSLTFGYTLDEMPGGTLDEITLPLDSRVWTGGAMILSAFDADHRLSYFNGPTLQAVMESSEQAPFDPSLALVSDVRPLIDGGNPSVAIGTRNRLIDGFGFNSGTAINSIGTCPQRANGRYIRSAIVTNAGDAWTHFQGVEVECSPNGVR